MYPSTFDIKRLLNSRKAGCQIHLRQSALVRL